MAGGSVRSLPSLHLHAGPGCGWRAKAAVAKLPHSKRGCGCGVVGDLQLLEYKKQNPVYQFRLALQIHDSLLFEVPIPELRHFIKNVMRQCMVENVPIWPRYLDNTPMPVAKPYHFGIDYKIQLNWGEDIAEEDMKRLGIDPELLA